MSIRRSVRPDGATFNRSGGPPAAGSGDAREKKQPRVSAIPTDRRRRLLGASLAVTALLASPELAGGVGAQAAAVTVTPFAAVPSPGHPFGVLATDDAVYAATSAGSPMNPNAGPEAVFKYSSDGGDPQARADVPTMPTMGLSGMAQDSAGRVYVVDMNGRILRFTPTPTGLTGPETYATVPDPYATLGWPASMWTFLAFDHAGNLYVTDAAQGAIWLIPPGTRTPTIWLQCQQWQSVPVAGLNGIAFGPDHDMYLVLASTPVPDQQPAPPLAESIVYRLPMPTAGQRPACSDVQTVHEFGFAPDRHPAFPPTALHPTPWPIASDLAFAASGDLYVSLAASDQIAELHRDGTVTTIDSDILDLPISLRFHGNELLVANSNYIPPHDGTHWQLLKVDVGEPGLPLTRPAIK